MLDKKILASLRAHKVNTDDGESLWKFIKETTFAAAKEVFGFHKRKNKYWFNDNDPEIHDLIGEKNPRFKACLGADTEGNRKQLSQARSCQQRRLGKVKEQWWLQKEEELQSLADKNSSTAFFTGLKETYGPQKSTSSSILSKDDQQILTEKSQVLNRWKEHFSELLNCESLAHKDALHSIQQLPVKEDLGVSPSIKELEQAINGMQSGKAPGLDGIPTEVFIHGSKELKKRLLHLIHV